jgi:hypothetical protein
MSDQRKRDRRAVETPAESIHHLLERVSVWLPPRAPDPVSNGVKKFGAIMKVGNTEVHLGLQYSHPGWRA